ncbi:TetR/AcrR family transcriptional regulator [Desulfosporosinus meridiei]|uniref:Transcriptional regulator, tetR family n=1 Tax=Desulfosporosinus meridiei (strain ATCC BAA-275 / DSM 13257 / KCTC 12902 / NCIMB 13706 / S10) TaxID=768704 RepID=J7J251_DESMD|nr:TetR/AcrR family transcriptional regulator [Desulfosporosinus meridiei]AFQ45051.1 transcriptional regulator, tetR family [Desulfosporosinus meridiei DSM 13257]
MQYLKDEVKQRILESALAEFSSMGYTDASMCKIAKNAKVALGKAILKLNKMIGQALVVVSQKKQQCLSYHG